MTGEAGDGVVLGKRGILEEFLAEGNPLLDQGVVHRQIRHGEGGRHLEAKRRVFLREFDGAAIFGRSRGRNGGKELPDPEGAPQICGEIVGQRIIFPGVGGDAVPGDGDGMGGVQKGTKIKIQSEGAVVAKVEGCCQANGGSPGISCEMVRVACGLLISFSEIAFQGEKDVTSLPVPVKSVDVGVKWIFCRDLGNVGMIGLLVGAKIEADGPISEGGNVVKDELKPMPFSITPSVLIGEFRPSPRIFFECKSRKKKADPGEGKGFSC